MPFLKEEKSEHERALRAGESYPTPLRATLRTPSFKNGQSRAFSRSRRAAGFLLHTFLSPPKEKCERPLGRQVPIRAGVGASIPTGGWGLRLRAHWGLSARPRPLRIATRTIERPIGLQALPSRRYRRVRPRQGELLTAKLSFIDASRGLSARPLHPFGESAYPQGGSMCLRAHQRAFLGEKKSARPALPYTPLVASLISRF